MSFWELVVVAVVALVVLGPERLPGAIRGVSQFIRGMKQFGQQMQAELNDELRIQELHQKLRQAEEKGLLNLTEAELQAMSELRQAAAEVTNPYPTTKKADESSGSDANAPQAKPSQSTLTEQPLTTSMGHHEQHKSQ